MNDKLTHVIYKKDYLKFGFIIMAWLIFTSILYNNRDFYHDDAYITLRYAQNFLNGNGIVWNVGEYVQGYSNFLHLLLISIFGKLGVDLRIASQVISFFSFIILLFISWQIPKSFKRRDSLLKLFPFIVVLTSSPLIVWVIGGLEPVVYSCFLSLGVFFFIKAHQAPHTFQYISISSIAFSLSALTRPDGMLFLVVSFFALGLLWNKTTLKSLFFFVIPATIIIGPYLTWVYMYYGNFLPNTYYAKATGFNYDKLIQGINYVKYFCKIPTYLYPIFFGLFFSHIAFKKNIPSVLKYFSSIAITYTLYVIYVGGDHMVAYRFFVPIIPLLGYGIYIILTEWEILYQKKFLQKIILAVYIALGVYQFNVSILNPIEENPASKVGTVIGKYINKNWEKGSLIALNTAGSTPYFAKDFPCIDMLGLTDSHIARRKITKFILPWQKVHGHSKGDGQYVLNRNPDYIIVGPAEGTLITKPWFLSDWEMMNDKRFHKNYELHQIPINNSGDITSFDKKDYTFTFYKRK